MKKQCRFPDADSTPPAQVPPLPHSIPELRPRLASYPRATRTSPQKGKGCGVHLQTDQELLRAALRFARSPKTSLRYGAAATREPVLPEAATGSLDAVEFASARQFSTCDAGRCCQISASSSKSWDPILDPCERRPYFSMDAVWPP
jgi:hypothetical protein